MSFNVRAWLKAKFAEVIRSRENMHSYQQEVVEFCHRVPRGMVLMDMGMGKSISLLTVVADLLDDPYETTLVVGPMRVVSQTWPNEIGEWAHTAHMSHTLIRAEDDDPRVKEAARQARSDARLRGEAPGAVQTAANKAMTAMKEVIRKELVKRKTSIHLISFEWLEWLVNYWGPKWPYKMVIVDEASGLKDYKSNRFNALRTIRNRPGLIERIYLLTATPAAETYESFFTLMFLVDGGATFGKAITNFRRDYFTENRYTRKWEIHPAAKESLLEKIAPYSIVMRADDHLKLEAPTIMRRMVYMSEAEMALYEELAADSVVKLPSGAEVEADTAAALSAKLLQMASGVLYETYSDGPVLAFDDDPDDFDMKKVKRVHHIHDQKMDELRQIIEEANGEPIIVSYAWQATLQRLQKAFPHGVKMDRKGDCVKPWNKGKIPLLFMHPKSGGHGLNLQHGGHIMVIFDPFHSLDLYLQLIGRLARQGQKHPVRIYILTAAKTLDEAVVDALREKEDNQNRMFTMLKKLIRKLKKERELELVDDEI